MSSADLEILENETDAKGRKIEVHKVYIPKTVSYTHLGELITKEIAQYIVYAKEKGCSMQGTEDPAVEYLKVLKQ